VQRIPRSRGFRAEAEQGLLFGFDGKSLIHPDQIAPCNERRSRPATANCAWAKAVIDAFAQPENAGKGAIKVDGKMVELLHRDQAKQLVAMADYDRGEQQGLRPGRRSLCQEARAFPGGSIARAPDRSGGLIRIVV
jgi:citrate lyase beta subunit